ncbi:hypothetical protein PIB30_020177 [Stylosanthes scabra]|uniref:Uncharacterized protein n=1 Tax=Stylosanthes scabra TaxID=79078 RepID=A0ABU6Q8I9_9FABA|nr:hypothetical protein [Stylosanthes scabra]
MVAIIYPILGGDPWRSISHLYLFAVDLHLEVFGNNHCLKWRSAISTGILQMPRRPRYPKISNLFTSEQLPHEEAPVASSIQQDDPPISSAGGGVPAATSCRPFRPPRIETVPSPQLNITDNQNQGTQDEDVNPLANDVDSFDDHVDRLFEASDAGNRRGRRTANHRLVNVIDKNFLILKP